MLYNKLFQTSFDTSSDKFPNYYKDISSRMKNREIDLLIVLNMFLTKFDATTLNTLWVDKNLKQHGLIQAFSRTNRILNSVKTFGNIICFRNVEENVKEAISIFANNEDIELVTLRTYDEYLNGFIDFAEMEESEIEKYILKNNNISNQIKVNSKKLKTKYYRYMHSLSIQFLGLPYILLLFKKKKK